MTSIYDSIKTPHGQVLAAFPGAGIKCRVVFVFIYLFIFETSFQSVSTVSVFSPLLNLPQLHN